MGRLVVNAARIQDFSVEKIIEDDGFLVVYVTIYTDGAKFTKYRIGSDDCHPNLDRIIEDLQNALSFAQKSDIDFEVREDSDRSLLHITYPDCKSRQYSGQRLALFEKSRD